MLNDDERQHHFKASRVVHTQNLPTKFYIIVKIAQIFLSIYIFVLPLHFGPCTMGLKNGKLVNSCSLTYCISGGKSIQALRRRNERGGGWLTPPHTGDKRSATTDCKRQIDATFGDTFLDSLKTINPFRPSEGEMSKEDELPHPTQGKKVQQPQKVSIN